MSKNPFNEPDGSPLKDKLSEFLQWEKVKFINHLKTLSPDERSKVIESKLRIAHRMQSEATETPDFDTWKIEAIIPYNDLLKSLEQ